MDERKLGEAHDDDGSERYAGKKKTNNEVEAQHQSWHEQARFGGGRHPRKEKT